MKPRRGLLWLALTACATLASACVGLRSAPVPARTSAPVAATALAAASATPVHVMTLATSATPTGTPIVLTPATPTPAPAMPATAAPTAAQLITATSAPVPGVTSTSPAVTPRATATPVASQPVHLLIELETGADDLAFSPDGSLLAVGSADYDDAPQYAVEVWELATGRPRWSGKQAEWLRKVAFSPNGARVGSAAFDGIARLWDTATGAVVAEKKFGYWVYGLDFSAGGGWWATGALDGKVVVADAGSGETVMEFKNDLMVTDLALAPNGPWVAILTSGSYGPMRVIVRDIRTFEERVLAAFDGVSTGNVVFSPDTQWLAAPLGYRGEIAIWQTGTWEERARLSTLAGVSRLIVSPDGQRLATLGLGADQKSQVVVWETIGWRQMAQLALDDVGWDIAFSPDGRWLVIGLGQGIEHPALFEAQLWNATAGKLAARMPHSEQVLAVAFSADGKRIATGSHGAVKIWELRVE